MLSTERPEFEVQISALCAAYNVPATRERLEGYWIGLQKMNLAGVTRVVEHALGAEGPEKIPTTSALWTIHRALRAKSRPAAPAEESAAPGVDAFTAFANRALVEFLRQSGAATATSLQELVATKNRLADQFRLIATEDAVTAEEVREALFREFRRVHSPITWGEVEAIREQECRARGLRFVPRAA